MATDKFAAESQEAIMNNSSSIAKKILFIGAGSMAEAIIRGLVDGKIAAPEKVYAVNRSGGEKMAALEERYGIQTGGGTENTRTFLGLADIVVLAMKPKDVADSLKELRDSFREDQLVVSVVAGLSIQTIHLLLDRELPVARTMPNTSSSIGLGATGICFSKETDETDRELTLSMFRAVGEAVIVQEEQLSMVTGVSGSGPAYIYYMMESMIAGGIKAGLSPEEARLLTVQTVLGAASMVQTTGEDPSALRKKVTSPNGTTQAALELLDQFRFPEAVESAVLRASERDREIGESISSSALNQN